MARTPRRRRSAREAYAAINRALSEAVRRINANKRGYLHYFIDNEKGAEVKALSIDDFNLNRIVFVEPGKPIPQEQLDANLRLDGELEPDRRRP